MNYKNIFITGADGFIGSHLTEKLIQKGYNVKALAQYNSFNNYGWLDCMPTYLKNNYEKHLGDIRDQSQMHELIKGSDVVFHLASLIGIPYSYAAPSSYIDTNINGTLNILQASLKHKVGKIIHTSTSEVYGSAEFVPMTETHALKGQSPYSATKIAADQLAFSYYTSFDLPITICRPFNTYGPRQSMRAVIPTIIVQLLNNKDSINLGSLQTSRDFNFIDDTVSGFVCSMLSEKNLGETINIGNSFEISIKNAVEIISKNFKKEIQINCEQERIRPQKSEVDRLFADNGKAKKLLNWEPKYFGIDGFDKGIKKTIEWFSNSENLKKYSNTGYVF